MKTLPKSKDNLGYTSEEIKAICRALHISYTTFNKKFGVNTCAVGADGKPRYYKCDIERTLYAMGIRGELGKDYMWD